MTLTRRFAAAGELLGIPVLDQVVIGERRFASLKGTRISLHAHRGPDSWQWLGGSGQVANGRSVRKIAWSGSGLPPLLRALQTLSSALKLERRVGRQSTADHRSGHLLPLPKDALKPTGDTRVALRDGF